MSLLPPAIVRLIDAQFRPLANIFELAISLAWALTGVAYLSDTDAERFSVVGYDASPYDLIWSIFYLIALPLIWAGVIKMRPHWRVSGLLLLGTGLLIHGLIAVQHNFSDDITDPRALIYWVYSVAVFLRAAVIVRYFGTKKAD